MKGTDNFKQVIEEYVNNFASTNATFAEKFSNKSKNIDDCITYILNKVKASGCNGFADDEIFGMAIHYYEEQNIEVGKPIDTMVVVNRIMEQQSRAKEQEEQLQQVLKLVKPKTKKAVEQIQSGQVSLF
jgi:hypothetical protein